MERSNKNKKPRYGDSCRKDPFSSGARGSQKTIAYATIQEAGSSSKPVEHELQPTA
jgi:hypothetical protein